jgi:TRAP-type C4-dicarboxylate transport system permease small subunit
MLGLFAALVSFATVAAMTWRLWAYAGQLAASGRTTSALRIPLSWVAWIAVVGSAVYAAGVAVTASRGAEPPEADVAGAAKRPPDDAAHGGTVGDVT